MAQSANHKWLIVLLMSMIGGLLTALLLESSQPPAEIIGEVPGLDKVAHFVAFGMLGLLTCAVSFQVNPRPMIPLLSTQVLLVILCGLIEESYQLFVPGRTASLADLLADSCGAITSVVLFNRILLLSRLSLRLRS